MGSEILGTGVESEIGFNDVDTHADKLAKDQEINTPDADTTSQDAGDTGTTQDPDGGQDSGWDTGVNGIKSNGERGGLPVFDVTPAEFFNNMKLDRRKLVFKRGTPCQQYHRGTNYRQHFWIRNTEDGHIRKVGQPKLGGIGSF
jgi:hypothetical protein